MNCLRDEFWAAEILWRLPVKSIIQYRCVCKSWRSLITAPKFISKYVLNNTKKTLNPQTFMHQSDIIKIKTGNCLLLFDNNEDDHLRPMLLHLTRPSPSGYTFLGIIGSVNGLICISISQGVVQRIVNYILFNPSIGRFLSIDPALPPPADTSSTFFQTVNGLGFDETTQDYKILSVVSKEDCFIYSLNSNYWKKLNNTPHVVTGAYSSFFVNGRMHWLGLILRDHSCINLIMFFDVKGETFGDISLPKCLVPKRRSSILSMAEFGESSIAVISTERIAEHVCDIWVMKEYGSVESWFKLATLRSKVYSKVLGFRNKEEVLATKFENKNGCIVSQNINNSGNKDPVKILMNLVHQFPCIFNAYKYVPSLVLLDKEKNFDAAIEKNFDKAMDVTSDFELRQSKRARKAPDRYH